MLALDFDGVLTDNKVISDEFGKEMITCDRRDSLGIEMLRCEAHVEVLVISKEKNHVVNKRCEKLKIECISGVNNKLSILSSIVHERKISFSEVAYIGNDVNDIECIRESGIGVAVSDSDLKVLEIADIVTKKNGGNGAVREFIDMLLNEKQKGDFT